MKVEKASESAGSRLLTYLPFVITIATIIIGLVQYKSTVEREIRKEFFYKQVASYETLINSVSGLVNYTGSDKDSLRNLYEHFKVIRSGSYLLYTADTVNFYVTTFDYYYDRFLRNDSISRTSVQNIAYKLINSCRYSLNQTIGADLNDLQFRESIK